MEFLNYDKIISEKRESIIESYLWQYGENNKDLLVDRFDKIKYCFFETPSTLERYLEIKSNIVGAELTSSCLKELNINDFKILGCSITSKNELIQRVIQLVFLHGQTISLFNNKCSYFSNISLSDILLIENITNKKIDEVIKIVEKHMNQFNNMFADMLDYTCEFQERISQLELEKYLKLLKTTILLKKYHPLYQELKYGLDYLKDKYSVSDDEIFLLECEVKSVLYIVERAKFQQCIINNYNPNEFNLNVDFFEVINDPHIFAFSGYEKNVNGIYCPVVFFSPLDVHFGFSDIIFDHETRHAMEMSLLSQSSTSHTIKCGLSTLYYKNGNLVNSKLRNLDETVTQDLSINSTAYRQRNNIFIFDESKYLNSSLKTGYDQYIPKLKEEFSESEYKILVASKLDNDLQSLYKEIPYRRLKKINDGIMSK